MIDVAEINDVTRNVPLLPELAAPESVMYWPTQPSVMFAYFVSVALFPLTVVTDPAVPV